MFSVWLIEETILGANSLNIDVSVGGSGEYGLRIQEFFKEPIFGFKINLARVSGSGDVVFTNARVVYSI